MELLFPVTDCGAILRRCTGSQFEKFLVAILKLYFHFMNISFFETTNRVVILSFVATTNIKM